MLAAGYGLYRITGLLRRAGANCQATFNGRYTAMHIALACHHYEVVNLLAMNDCSFVHLDFDYQDPVVRVFRDTATAEVIEEEEQIVAMDVSPHKRAKSSPDCAHTERDDAKNEAEERQSVVRKLNF